ncbi:MAG: 6,7-dimethyl-8-ribityllumazine synthase [Xanthomonadaceae bacterium]|nr:6,7-dimethyl-8-ribityllumazine synthase [Xanthomonadaceae bacterium]
MSKERPGSDDGWQLSGARIAIVAARYNASVVDKLLAGALDTLHAHGIDAKQVEVVRVPGAWELPLAAAHLADQDRFDALIALGAVIRGGTPHFEYVCDGCATGLMQVQQEFGVPVAFGVLTCDDDAQARARAVDGPANKGAEAALAALEMIDVLRRLDV